MDGQKEAVANAATKSTGHARQRSTIGFPYTDLKSAIELADAIHSQVGLRDCDDDQLAAWTKQSSKSSTFRVQVYAARTFRVLEGDGSNHRLSELGRAIVDPKQAREAKARAFLAVPLYKAVYEKYRGGVLPPAAALSRDMVALGVSEKQKDRARLVFERSAEEAGFFEHGKQRLVMPGVAYQPDVPGENGSERPEPEKGGGGEPPSSKLHPFIQGLLQTLPKPETEWAATARVKWLQTAANIFDLIYKGDGGIKIETAMAQRSPRPSEYDEAAN
jgi:hypothetical protein